MIVKKFSLLLSILATFVTTINYLQVLKILTETILSSYSPLCHWFMFNSLDAGKGNQTVLIVS
jgi:hypothetical protein